MLSACHSSLSFALAHIRYLSTYTARAYTHPQHLLSAIIDTHTRSRDIRRDIFTILSSSSFPLFLPQLDVELLKDIHEIDAHTKFVLTHDDVDRVYVDSDAGPFIVQYIQFMIVHSSGHMCRNTHDLSSHIRRIHTHTVDTQTRVLNTIRSLSLMDKGIDDALTLIDAQSIIDRTMTLFVSDEKAVVPVSTALVPSSSSSSTHPSSSSSSTHHHHDTLISSLHELSTTSSLRYRSVDQLIDSIHSLRSTTDAQRKKNETVDCTDTADVE